ESNAEVKTSNAQSITHEIGKEVEVEEEVFEEKTIYEEKEVWETVGLLRKKKVKKTVKVPKTIKVPKKVKVKKKIEGQIRSTLSNATAKVKTPELRIQYDSRVEALTNFWKALKKKEYSKTLSYLVTVMEELGEQFDSTLGWYFLHSIPDEKKMETMNEMLKFPKLIARYGSEKALKELGDILTSTLSSGLSLEVPMLTEALKSRLKLTFSGDLADSLKVTLDFSNNDFLKMDESLIELPRTKKGQSVTKTITVIPLKSGDFRLKVKIKAILEKHEIETEKTIPVKVEKLNLDQVLSVTIPPLTEALNSTVGFTINNDLADSLKVILDLSGNNFLKLGKTKLEFQELKKGQKASRTIKIQPLKPGNFNLKIKIKAIVNGVELETKKTIPLKVEKLDLEKILHVAVPQLAESFEAPLKLTITNNLADSLKLTLDLSGNEFFELEETEVEFPELKKGQEIAKTVMITPKYAGNFDFKIKIKALVNGIELEAEKVIPVEVAERTATPQTPAIQPTPLTPSPTTPVPPSASYPTVTSFPAELLNFYEPIEELGRGGFARVFKAKRKSDGEIVAVKIPLSLDPITGKSFLKEIENWTKLRHPNIVRVYDYNILPVPFFEMEYCDGSLERIPMPMNVKEAALLVFNIAEGLKYAHSKGIIHRDLKPSNILLKNGIPKISDWGLSKVLGQSGTTTTSFTALYAAPEQFSKSKFGPTDERTDIWQLGVIFYQLVTGKLPFESDDPFELMFLIMNEEPEKLSEFNSEAGDVEPIILRMLAKEKDERYENVVELQSDLASYLGIEFRRELKRSRTMGDKRLIVYYLGNLLIMSVKMGNLSGAYKYASDFTMLTEGELRREFEALSEQFKLRLEERLEVPVELIEKTDILVHKAMVRVR
ncbi:protein kinase domain-containing protein, partial [Thermococcus sp.]